MRTAIGRSPIAGALGWALACLAVLTSPGCGGDDEPAGPLRWQGEPAVAESEVEGERIASGEVRNSSLEVVTIKADDLVVVADAGELDTDTTFLAGYGRGFVETSRGYADPDDVPEFEQVRTGRLLKLPPGGTSPIVVAWRDEGGEDAEVEGVRYPLGFLPFG